MMFMLKANKIFIQKIFIYAIFIILAAENRKKLNEKWKLNIPQNDYH